MQLEAELKALLRGVVEALPEGGLAEKLAAARREKRPLIVKAGFDPTAPDLHLGHLVLLEKLRQFQSFGHEVAFVIGDFTARIGDPSGRNETRPPLSEAEVQANARTYAEQVFKVLDPERTRVCFNSEWLGKLSAADLIRLAATTTVARMLERDDFEKRYRAGIPIALHEFLYPLLQGYDSVTLRADVEIGGTDQKFNLLMGRHLQEVYGQPPQVVLTMPLLEGTDGVRKMSKSFGNYVGLLEPPEEQFGKIMRISDELMLRYYELLTDEDLDAVRAMHPMAAKKRLAWTIVARFHGEEAANRAQAEFERVFSARQLPERIPEVPLAAPPEGLWIAKALALAGLVASTSEAVRLIRQGAVRVDEARITDKDHKLAPGAYLVRVGKRRFARLVLQPSTSEASSARS